MKHSDYLKQESEILTSWGWHPCSDDASEEYTIFDFYSDLFPLDQASFYYALFAHFEDSDKYYFDHYVLNSAADIDFMVSQLPLSTNILYPSSYRPLGNSSDRQFFTARSNNLSRLHAICVDIDPSDGDWVLVSPVLYVLPYLSEALNPDYISLSGNGLHLWYIFDCFPLTFGPRSFRRLRLEKLVKALYSLWDSLLPDYGVDLNCATLVHGFRAPGSLSKYGDQVPLFRSPTLSKTDPSALSKDLLNRGYLSSADDILILSDGDFNEAPILRFVPATPKQISFLRFAHSQGLLSDAELSPSKLEVLSKSDASSLISRIRPLVSSPSSNPSLSNKDYSEWHQKPHPLISGKTGGIYRVFLDNITQVPPGRRYLAMKALAGVAFMMVSPSVSKEQLSADLYSLLGTPWAGRHGSHAPLSKANVRSALKCYCEENRQTKKSLIKILGFNPFGTEIKRNHLPREVHLSSVAAAKKESSKAKLIAALNEDPTLTISAAAQLSGLSRKTASLHWEAACNELGIDSARRSGRPRSNRQQ